MAQRVRPTKQAVDTDVSVESSLRQVQTLLETGVGCLAYLRGLFPDEAFEDSTYKAPRAPVSSSNPPSTSQFLEAKKGDESSVKVKRLVRGHSSESDKLLDYIERGAADAIAKGFLHQLVLAIYLDPNDPTNIVEAYTFTFTYQTTPSGEKRPELEVRDRLGNMFISSSFAGDKSKRAVKEGDVKRQVQRLIKSLITSTQALDELPRRRFLNVRLFYYDSTPPDYEPPFFSPVNADQAKYRLATVQTTDEPDMTALGAIDSGFHGVSLHTISIANQLEVVFDDTISSAECLSRNRRDAATRSVVWDADTLVHSITDEEGSFLTSVEPIGIRDAAGQVHEVQDVQREEKLRALRIKVGLVDEATTVREKIAVARGEADSFDPHAFQSDNEALRKAIAELEGQQLTQGTSTQIAPVVSRLKSHRPEAPLLNFGQHAVTNVVGVERMDSALFASQHDSQTGTKQNKKQKEVSGGERLESGQQTMAMAVDGEDVNETQLLEFTQASTRLTTGNLSAPLQSVPAVHAQATDTVSTPMRKSTRIVQAAAETAAKQSQSAQGRGKGKGKGKRREVVGCECGAHREDDGMICCSKCEIWKHCVCYGYEGVNDSRIPDEFWCYPCRLGEDPIEAHLHEKEIQDAMNNLRSLALYRRALAIVWEESDLEQKDLGQRLGIDRSTAAQVVNRLREEKYIHEEQSQAKKGGKSRASAARNTGVKRGQLVVNKTLQQKRLKRDVYFSPGQGAELECLEADTIMTQVTGSLKRTGQRGDDGKLNGDTIEEETQRTASASVKPTAASAKQAAAQSDEDSIEDAEDASEMCGGTLEMPLMTPEQAAKAARDSAAARAAKNGTSSSQHTTFKGLVTARKSVASDQAAVQGSAASAHSVSASRMDIDRNTPDEDSQLEPDTVDDVALAELSALAQRQPGQALRPITRHGSSNDASRSATKRASHEDGQEAMSGQSDVRASAKRSKKCSEGGEIEV